MAWLEMSRDETHGGEGWSFGVCLWCLTERRGGGRWGYWEVMQRVRSCDTVIHLRGRQPNAYFVGVSEADADAYETARRPPDPGEWNHAERFIRVPLRNFVAFDEPLALTNVFESVGEQLLSYHFPKKSRDSAKVWDVVKQATMLILVERGREFGPLTGRARDPLP